MPTLKWNSQVTQTKKYEKVVVSALHTRIGQIWLYMVEYECSQTIYTL